MAKNTLKYIGFTYFAAVLYLTLIFNNREQDTDFQKNLNLRLFYKFSTFNMFNWKGQAYFIAEILGNLFLFFPFSISLYFIFGKKTCDTKVFISVFLLSVVIEVIQYCFNIGVADIDDVFFNTLGGVLGIVFFNKIYIT